MADLQRQESGWNLRLYGRFSLTDASGRSVRLPDRKTEALLAILVLNGQEGIFRQEAADILWPDRSPRNLTNLRQALAVLRRNVGASAFEASSRHLRLAADFPLCSDHEETSLRRSETFMLGHEGDWFDLIRANGKDGGTPDESTDTVVDQFTGMLRWLAIHDPAGMYGMLRAAPPVARSLPFLELESLLRTTKHAANQSGGWHSFWMGTIEHDLELCKRLLRHALREAKQHGDLVLASEVILELGRACARTGEFEQAQRLCDLQDEVAERLQTLQSRINAQRLRATVCFQWNDPIRGNQLFRELQDSMTHPMEAVTLATLRAFFEASQGWYERAEQSLQEAAKIHESGRHFRAGIVGSTTRVLLRVAAGGSRSEGIKEFEALSRCFYSANADQFGVYTEELAARLYSLEGNQQKAAELTRSAQNSRKRAQMYTPPLETRRLAMLH